MEQLFELKNLHEMPIEYNFGCTTIPCKIKGSLRIGQYFGSVMVFNKPWAIVLFSGDTKPTFMEINSIEVLKLKWVDLKIATTSEDHDNE